MNFVKFLIDCGLNDGLSNNKTESSSTKKILSNQRFPYQDSPPDACTDATKNVFIFIKAKPKKIFCKCSPEFRFIDKQEELSRLSVEFVKL